MKKLAKVLALVALSVVLCLGVVAFAACGGGKTYKGEYHYNSNNNEYGIVVNVTVDDGKITKVVKVDSEYVECTAALPNYGWTEDRVAAWNDNLANLLKAYEGKTVEEIKAINVVVGTGDNAGVPGNAEDQSWAPGDLCITGATQGSARLLLAVQNALSKI